MFLVVGRLGANRQVHNTSGHVYHMIYCDRLLCIVYCMCNSLHMRQSALRASNIFFSCMVVNDWVNAKRQKAKGILLPCYL